MKRLIFAAASIFAISSNAMAATCSVDQYEGKQVSSSWVADAPENFSEIVKNKLILIAQASSNPVFSRLPYAVVMCFDADGTPTLSQKLTVSGRDSNGYVVRVTGY